MIWALLILAILIAVLFIGRSIANRSITQYSVDEVQALLNEDKAVLLDVRTHDERAMKSIPGSLHIPLQMLSQQLGKLEKHKGKEIVCYCRTGNRSMGAADMLGKNGFQSASMKGGIMAWREPEGKKKTQ